MITIRRPVLKRCPFADETDAGELVIVFPEDAPELHNLGEQIDILCREPATHEEFTLAVLDLLGGVGLVRTTWHTGPWSVEVTEGALPGEPVEPAGA
jgi:hypothetical protein